MFILVLLIDFFELVVGFSDFDGLFEKFFEPLALFVFGA
jgi:hypothetical protein